MGSTSSKNYAGKKQNSKIAEEMFLDDVKKYLRTEQWEKQNDTNSSNSSIIVLDKEKNKQKSKNTSKAFRKTAKIYIKEFEQAGQKNIDKQKYGDKLKNYAQQFKEKLLKPENFNYQPFNQNTAWLQINQSQLKQRQSINNDRLSQFQEDIIQTIYKEIRQAKKGENFIKDLICLFQEIFYLDYSGQMNFPAGKIGLTEKKCEQVKDLRNEAVFMINSFIELCLNVIYFTYKQTINSIFYEQDHIDLKIHKIISFNIFGSNKKFYKLVDKIFAFSLKFEDLNSKAYIQINQNKPLEFFNLDENQPLHQILTQVDTPFKDTIDTLNAIERKCKDPWEKFEKIASLKQCVEREIDKTKEDLIQREKKKLEIMILQHMQPDHDQSQSSPKLTFTNMGTKDTDNELAFPRRKKKTNKNTENQNQKNNKNKQNDNNDGEDCDDDVDDDDDYDDDNDDNNDEEEKKSVNPEKSNQSPNYNVQNISELFQQTQNNQQIQQSFKCSPPLQEVKENDSKCEESKDSIDISIQEKSNIGAQQQQINDENNSKNKNKIKNNVNEAKNNPKSLLQKIKQIEEDKELEIIAQQQKLEQLFKIQVNLQTDDYVKIFCYCMVKSNCSRWQKNQEFTETFIPDKIHLVLGSMAIHFCNYEQAVQNISYEGKELYDEYIKNKKIKQMAQRILELKKKNSNHDTISIDFNLNDEDLQQKELDYTLDENRLYQNTFQDEQSLFQYGQQSKNTLSKIDIYQRPSTKSDTQILILQQQQQNQLQQQNSDSENNNSSSNNNNGQFTRASTQINISEINNNNFQSNHFSIAQSEFQNGQDLSMISQDSKINMSFIDSINKQNSSNNNNNNSNEIKTPTKNEMNFLNQQNYNYLNQLQQQQIRFNNSDQQSQNKSPLMKQQSSYSAQNQKNIIQEEEEEEEEKEYMPSYTNSIQTNQFEINNEDIINNHKNDKFQRQQLQYSNFQQEKLFQIEEIDNSISEDNRQSQQTSKNQSCLRENISQFRENLSQFRENSSQFRDSSSQFREDLKVIQN